MTDFVTDLPAELAASLLEQGRLRGMIQERQAIADWVQSHVSWMPGGPEWATNLLKFLAERTEQPEQRANESHGVHRRATAGRHVSGDAREVVAGSFPPPPEPTDEPLDERCGLWFLTDGQRAQCYEPAHHSGAHASFEEMEAWRQIREQARWRHVYGDDPLAPWQAEDR